MKTPDEAMDLIESMDASDIAILRDRAHIPTKKSLLELTSQDTLLAQYKLLSKQLETLTETLKQFAYEVNYMGNQPRGNFNTSGFPGLQNNQQYQQQRQWQNHPGNQFNRDQGGSSTRPQQQMPSLYNRNLAQFMQVSMSNQKRIESVIKNLEVQVVQLAKQLAKRPSNSFRANTEKNPKEECKAVMTRSKMVIQAEESRADKKVEGFKQQLADELALEPDLLTKKNRYIHSDKIVVEGYCSVVIQCILPPKHKDRGVVTIPCFIAEVVVGKALIDLGASINLMPLSMCRRLGEIEIMPTRMTLQLANCSITPPYGVIEDVLVKVKHLIFPPDLVVIDIEEDADIPLILGCPFMSIASCMVDVGKKILQMGIEDQL
ncbi:uncharacterized protein [Glycine max]|uniref:uncharacterized protein n=1 Tax=Glycine max TaxID=3847 RepID=UPI0003DEBEBF|nr:uncharacterized protein LOC102661293 [Glycine max]|eukprot:XP_006576014.1 uncharacterized protein LOC102661293 [Glycine max]